MSSPRLWWLDSSDLRLASEKIEAAKESQFADWDWVNFCEDNHDSKAEAFGWLLTELRAIPMFAPGKAVICHGVPSFQAKLTERLNEIPEGAMLVVVAKQDKTISLFKEALKRAPSGFSLIEEKPVVDQLWVAERAKAEGLVMDGKCCQAIITMCGADANSINMEMLKLRHASHDREVGRTLIEMVVSESGSGSVMDMCDALIVGDMEGAHAELDFLLGVGDDPEKICGFLMDWSRRLMLATGNIDGEDIGKIKKMIKNDKGGFDVSVMFSKPGSLYYSVKKMREASRPASWPAKVINYLWRLQVALRTGRKRDGGMMMHEFLEAIQ